MLNSKGSVVGFLIGTAMTIGLLLSPHLIPGALGYGLGYKLSGYVIAILIITALIILAGTLNISARLIKGASSWKEPKVILAAVLIAFNANALYVMAVEFFKLQSGMRSLIAVLGVPVIYGNLSATLRKINIKSAMIEIFSGALATMGAGFIITSLIKGW